MEAINPGRDLVIRVTVACGVLATLAVCLRLLARRKTKASFGADDWVMVASLIPSYGMLAVGSIMITSGRGGQHSDTLTKSQMATFLKTLDASVITYTLTISMVKISILLLYRRVFPIHNFERATLIVGITCISWLIAALLCLAFQCRTKAERYNVDSLFSDQCIDLKAYWIAITASNMALDLVILCMPLYMVWNLMLTVRQKLALSGLFTLGALWVDSPKSSAILLWLTALARVCVASLMRIITIDLVKGGDLSYTIVTCYMWSQIEPTMAIVCACLTTVRPLFAGLDLSFLSSINWTRRTTTSSSSANSKGRRSDLSGSLQGQEKKFKRLSFKHSSSDMQLLDIEQTGSPGVKVDTAFVDRAERQNESLEDGTSGTLSVKSAVSVV